MARLTLEAQHQVDVLVKHFLDLDRVEAVLRLNDAVEAALLAVDNPTTSWATFPRPYSEIADEGYRWIKQHRYWFAYHVSSDETVIERVFYDQADNASRIRGRR